MTELNQLRPQEQRLQRGEYRRWSGGGTQSCRAAVQSKDFEFSCQLPCILFAWGRTLGRKEESIELFQA